MAINRALETRYPVYQIPKPIPRLPKMSPQIHPWEKQRAFVDCSARHALYLGAASVGKTAAIVFTAIDYIQHPGARVLFVGQSEAALERAGGVIQTLNKAFPGAQIRSAKQIIRWHTGAEFHFIGIPDGSAFERLRGSEWAAICVDEGGEFAPDDLGFFLTRLRRDKDDPFVCKYRISANPMGGPSEEYFSKYFMARDPNGNKTDPNAPDYIGLDEDYAYFHGEPGDNPKRDYEDYGKSFVANPNRIDAERQLFGTIGLADSGTFDVTDFQWFDWDIRAKDIYRVWDLAFSTSHNADFTVGILVFVIEEDDGDHYYVGDIIRGKWKGGKVVDLIESTAKSDGARVKVVFEQQDYGQGSIIADDIAKAIAPLEPIPMSPGRRSKEVRAQPLMVVMSDKRVHLQEGSANIQAFVREFRAFPNKKVHDDCVDVLAYAVLAHEGKKRGDKKNG